MAIGQGNRLMSPTSKRSREQFGIGLELVAISNVKAARAEKVARRENKLLRLRFRRVLREVR